MNTTSINDRIQYIVDELFAGNKAAFAKAIKKAPTTIANILGGRKTMPSSDIVESVINSIEHINAIWLMTGSGEMITSSKLSNTMNEAQVEYSKEIQTPKTHDKVISCTTDPVQEGVYSGTLVYDIDATAGFGGRDINFTQENVIGCVCLPEIDKKQQIIGVSGDSMEPVLKNSDRIAIRKIESWDVIFWGQIYVIMTDEYRFVKYVKPHPSDKNYILLKSENNAKYDDIELSKNQIKSMFLVTNILRVETRAI